MKYTINHDYKNLFKISNFSKKIFIFQLFKKKQMDLPQLNIIKLLI